MILRTYLAGVVIYGLCALVRFIAREQGRILRSLSRALLWPATLAEMWFKHYYSFRRQNGNRRKILLGVDARSAAVRD